MLEQMPSRLLSEWMAYCNLDPFGEERADFRSAIIAKTIADVNRPEKAEPYPVENFMPLAGGEDGDGADEADDEDEQVERQRQMLAMVEQLNLVFGGKDMRAARYHSPG